MGLLRRSALFLPVLSLLALAGCGSGIAGVSAAVAPLQISSSLPQAVSGMMYSTDLQTGGDNSHYSWSVVNGAVPAGLQLDKASGNLSGVPQIAGTAQFAVAVSDDQHVQATRTLPITLTVVPQLAPVDATMPAAHVGSVFFKQVAMRGGQPPYAWSAPTGQLPPGVVTRDGIFLGMPTTNGNYNMTFQVSDSGSPKQVVTIPVSIVVGSSLSIAPIAAQKATYGLPFALPLIGSGGTPAYSWKVSSGSLPPGLGISPATGLISGVPTSTGTYTAQVTMQDRNVPMPGAISTGVTIAVAATPLNLTSAIAPSATVGASFQGGFQATGGVPSYTWAPTGSLPPGLSLNAATGALSGTPTTAGTYNFGVQVTDTDKPAQVKTTTASITVAPPALVLTAPVLPSATANSGYQAALQATGGTPGYTFSTVGALPAGVTLNPATGVLSGTPTTTGTFNFTVQVSDAGRPAQTKSAAASITVSATPLALTAPSMPSATANSAYQVAFQANGGTPSYIWSTVGALPAGLTINSATGVLSGTPTTTGTFNFTVQVSDAGRPAQTKSTAASITVAATPLALTAPSMPSATANSAFQVAFQATGGTPAYTWSTLGSLPAGLTINPASGVLSGTPTAAGTFNFNVQVSDGGQPAQTATVAATITVGMAPQALIAAGTTWYVRQDGGTRYSNNRTNGQCDGKSDAPYNGVGVNQHCAFNDVRFLWQDGIYDNGTNQGWVIAGGDTVIIRGSIADGVTYRIGWNNRNGAYEQSTDTWWGKPGDPYGSGMPIPPSGTALQHTRILGGNYGSCHRQTDRTQLHGGFGVAAVINLQGASYVDMQCLDITDFSQCGRSAQVNGCNSNPGTLDDYASVGVVQNNTTTHITLTDMRLHGLAGAGLFGPNGDGDVYSYFDIVGNANAGWNADNGTVGKGSALMQNFSISWNGCSEEYPIQSALPYTDCTDDNVGGYGDGFGTATIDGTDPWNVTFDNGVVSYNTQDGLDALHLVGTGSSMTITRVQAYGNMGQQIKVGGANGSAVNNVIVTNCNAMRMAIPGTPAGYNSRLSDFCRAADTGIYMATQDGSTTKFDFNTVYSASATTVQIGCGGTCTAGTDRIDFRNNIFLGFQNNAANGYLYGSTGDYANPIYVAGTNTFSNQGSVFDHNLTYHAKSNWSCPSNTLLHETNARCSDPGLVDETWHNYGIGDMSPVPGASLAIGAGVTLPGITISINSQSRSTPPNIGAYE